MRGKFSALLFVEEVEGTLSGKLPVVSMHPVPSSFFQDFLRFAVHYGRFSLHAGRSFGTQYRELHNGLARTLWVLGLPIGMGLYLKDQAKVKKQAGKS